MRASTNIFRFCSKKVAFLKEYKVPALEPDKTKDNLIWLHGIFDNSKSFLNLAQNKSLRKITNQVLLDARNHGLSEHSETNTYESMSKDLIEYIVNRNMKDIYLLGHSMGGRTILTALQKYQEFLKERVKGVIVVDVQPSSYAVEGTGPIDQVYQILQNMKKIDIEDEEYEEVKEKVEQIFKQDIIITSVLNNIQKLDNGKLKWLLNIEALENSFDNLMEHQIKDLQWKGPRKILIGGKSKFTSEERVKKDYPQVFSDFQIDRDLVVFQNSSHFLQLQEPDRFIDEVVQFIQKVNEEDNDSAKKKQKYEYEALTFDI